MSLPARAIKALDVNLRKYAPAYDVVYKRTTAVTAGGDELIGRSSTTFVDVKMDPQPLYKRPQRAEVGGFHRYKIIQDDGFRAPAVELILFCSVTALSQAELEDRHVSFVLVDGKGTPEVYEVIDYDYSGVQGTIYAWRVLIRSVKR